MKSVLDKDPREELIRRIGTLTRGSQSLWGKMTIYQMLKHCSISEEMYLGKKNYSRTFMGYIFGKRGLRNILNEHNHFPKNAPTLQVFRVIGAGDIESQKEEWIRLIREYEHFTAPFIIHFFFGRMTREEIGRFTYKHSDHHLKQFGA